MVMEGTAPAGTQAWDELLTLAQDEAGERALLERLLDLWRCDRGAQAAGLYLERDGHLEQEVVAGAGLPETYDESSPKAGIGVLRFPGGRLLYAPGNGPGAESAGAAGDPFTLLLASSLKSCRLKHDLKEQQFQINYRVVELEALYDVGLAVAATLDLDRLSEEILLRAVSLLDARRGALYILEDGRYRLDRTFGGEAASELAADDPELRTFLGGGAPPPARLLPGARYLLVLPIEVEAGPRGLLVVGDKESRRGVGPFLPGDRRTLSLFANQAALALENARLHLQALEKERLEREMHLAAEIQRQILPKGAPQVSGYQLAGWNRPARQVGGDYYDLFHLPGSRLGLVVGDVSGKGIPAALMVSTLHSALRLLLDQSEFGPALLERLNRHIVESSMPNKFITMLLAELNPETGVLHYLNAGHNPGVLLRRDGRVEELGPGGLPLGLLPSARYQSRAVTLEPGDLLCLYSDGITEAESPADEEFGMGRLIDLLRQDPGGPLQELLEEIPAAVGRFSQGRPQGDDQTLVLVRREGSGG
jgi:sigma-B regulation protein RsbU (phosphoserine phosphatase)